MSRSNHSFQNPERGGITILVVLSLLVLLTVASVAMSKNAIREVMIAGTARQGAEARSVADSGLEWSILWLDDADPAGGRPTPDSQAQALKDLAAKISDNPALYGHAQPLGSTVQVSSNADVTKSFDLALMYMGTVSTPGSSTSPQDSPGAIPVTNLAAWSVRSTGQLAYTSGPTFVHTREVWCTALPKGALASR
jgi:hypothetical protein